MSGTVHYSLAMFSPHVGSRFTYEPASGDSHIFELVEAASRGGDQDPDRNECFSLVFFDRLASAHSHLPQAMYAFEHDALGKLDLFIVPIGPDADREGMRYEAVFG